MVSVSVARTDHLSIVDFPSTREIGGHLLPLNLHLSRDHWRRHRPSLALSYASDHVLTWSDLI